MALRHDLLEKWRPKTNNPHIGEISLIRIQLTDFRGIKHLDLNLDSKTPIVFVGKNGAGKTSVLDAIFIALTPFLNLMGGQSAAEQMIQNDDVHYQAYSAEVELQLQIEGTPVMLRVSSSKDNGITDLEDNEITDLDELQREIKHILTRLTYDKDNVRLPLVIYYSANRHPLDRLLQDPSTDPIDFRDAYKDAVSLNRQDFGAFLMWFRVKEDSENARKVEESTYQDPELVAVRKAISEVMEGFSKIRMDRTNNTLVAEKNGVDLLFSQLSEGEKTILGIVGDLARRLALTNTGRENPLEGYAVVLIDEIELHLHPQWQRTIAPSLQRVFPNVQFIYTTHSAPVVSHVKDGVVFVLDV